MGTSLASEKALISRVRCDHGFSDLASEIMSFVAHEWLSRAVDLSPLRFQFSCRAGDIAQGGKFAREIVAGLEIELHVGLAAHDLLHAAQVALVGGQDDSPR